MDRDASRVGLTFSGRTNSVRVTWQPQPCVLTMNTFFSTIADLLVDELITVTDYAPVSPFCCLLYLYGTVFIFLGMLSVEVHEDTRDAANNLVKYFHKHEQEVCDWNISCLFPPILVLSSFNPMAHKA